MFVTLVRASLGLRVAVGVVWAGASDGMCMWNGQVQVMVDSLLQQDASLRQDLNDASRSSRTSTSAFARAPHLHPCTLCCVGAAIAALLNLSLFTPLGFEKADTAVSRRWPGGCNPSAARRSRAQPPCALLPCFNSR